MGYFDEIGKKISQTGQGMVQKTKDTAEVLKLNGLISDEQKRINQLYCEIGKQYYASHSDSFEPAFAQAFADIQDSLAKIETYSEQIRKLKKLMTCPNCGSSIPSGSQFCASCGTKLETPPPVVNSAPLCANCGRPLAPGAAFCTNCGTKVAADAPAQPAQEPPAPATLSCPNCGKELAPGTLFCTECGTRLGES